MCLIGGQAEDFGHREEPVDHFEVVVRFEDVAEDQTRTTDLAEDLTPVLGVLFEEGLVTVAKTIAMIPETSAAVANIAVHNTFSYYAIVNEHSVVLINVRSIYRRPLLEFAQSTRR